MNLEELAKLRKSLMGPVRDSGEEALWEVVGRMDPLAAILSDAQDYEGLCDMAKGTERYDHPSDRKFFTPLAKQLLAKLANQGMTPDEISKMCRSSKGMADEALRDYEEALGDGYELN